MVSDQYSDRSFRVLNSKLRAFPEGTTDLIKSAQVNYAEGETLPETAFAWPVMRKYAVHTPEHAVLSRIYVEGENVPSYVKESIDRALDLYGVELPLEEKVAAYESEKIDDYLVPHMRVGKMVDEESVKEASRIYSSNWRKMDMETRINAAVTLTKKAAQHNVDIPTKILKHAGLTQCNRSVAAEWIEARREIAPEGAIKTAYDKLSSYVSGRKNPINGREELLKLADTLYTLDKKAGFVGKYDRTLPDPVLTIFNTVKVAEATVTLAGKEVAVTKLMAIPKETYGDLLGDDILPEVCTADGELDQSDLIAVLETLPADMQTALVKNLRL